MIFYVYFDSETRDIVSVTNEKTNNNYSYVEKQRIDVEDFLQGTKNFLDYKLDTEFNIVVKDKQTKDVVTNSFVKITPQNDANLKITHSKNWLFALAKNSNNIKGNLFFAVTGKNNPNKLIRTISFDSQHASLGHCVDFKYTQESNIDNISIWAINPPYQTASLEIK